MRCLIALMLLVVGCSTSHEVVPGPAHEALTVTASPARPLLPPLKLSELKWSSRLARLFEGRTEVRLWDGSRVDIVTAVHAIEVEWAQKWPESFGQVGWYAINTAKIPVVILLVEDMQDDNRYVMRCQAVAVKYDVQLWIVDTQRSIIHYGSLEREVPLLDSE